MKFNQAILAVSLFFSVTAVQPLQAGVWDWCTAPVRYAVNYMWSFCPITKGGLKTFEEQQKRETTEEVNKLMAREEESKKAIDNKFIIINKKQEDLIEQAKILHGASIGLNNDSKKLATQLSELQKRHQEEMPKMESEVEEVKQKLSTLVIARTALTTVLTQVGDKSITLDEEVGTIATEFAAIKDQFATYQQQAQERDKSISRIKAMLQPKKIDGRYAFEIDRFANVSNSSIESKV